MVRCLSIAFSTTFYSPNARYLLNRNVLIYGHNKLIELIEQKMSELTRNNSTQFPMHDWVHIQIQFVTSHVNYMNTNKIICICFLWYQFMCKYTTCSKLNCRCISISRDIITIQFYYLVLST